MSKKLLLSLTVLFAGFVSTVHAQTVYFNGLGRALVSTDQLKGPVLNQDSTTARRGTGGYTIFDLGINAQPNENLRASAILRIRNEFGGFYGDGSSIVFRQLRLDGILSKIVKYEIGDIDLGLTQYTLYNFDESYHDYEADIFAIRRSVVHYENFNFGNKWRLQGGHANTNLKFSKGIEKIGIRAFATRIRQADFVTFSTPDRLLTGGRIDVTQSKFFQLGVNLTNMFDIAGTQPDTAFVFNNKVYTADYKLGWDNDMIALALYGEVGGSDYSYFRRDLDSTRTKKDYFYDLGLSGSYKPLDIKLWASYKNVGSDFSSPAAQTRRIFDFGTPSLFPVVLDTATNIAARQQVPREQTLIDRISDESSPRTFQEFSRPTGIVRNTIIQTGLMAFNPIYNNISPYGSATPNRKGLSFGVSAGENDKFYKADIRIDLQDEVIGEGGLDKRKFTGIRGGFLLNLNKALNWEKGLSVNFGIRNEHTTRSGANQIDLKSTLLDAGFSAEVIKNLEIIGGIKKLNAKGNEYLFSRDVYNSLVGLPFVYRVDVQQNITAAGIRYRFTKNTYFTGQYNLVKYVDNLRKANETSYEYQINQLFLKYTMIF